LRVLVVDDEKDTRTMLEMVFEKCGAEVITAASAREALRVYEKWKPGVMICDIGMPDEDGYSLIRDVRAAEAGHAQQTPALALTGYARSEDRAQALSAGYQMHIAKPIDLLELTTAVAALSKRIAVS
jgi:CheY-like chemotaxis protein